MKLKSVLKIDQLTSWAGSAGAQIRRHLMVFWAVAEVAPECVDAFMSARVVVFTSALIEFYQIRSLFANLILLCHELFTCTCSKIITQHVSRTTRAIETLEKIGTDLLASSIIVSTFIKCSFGLIGETCMGIKDIL